MIKWIRHKYGIPSVSQKRSDEISVRQAAERFGVSIRVVYYWIKRHVVTARQIDGRGPWSITTNPTVEAELRNWVSNSKHLTTQNSNDQL